MGNMETPPVDKDIAAKVFSSAKLDRIRNYEERKLERERNLLVTKRSALPAIEGEFARQFQSKCNSCNVDRETYGSTFDRHLEPIDALQMETSKGFYGLSRYDRTRRMLSSVAKSLVIHPVQIKMLKHLQEIKRDVPIVFVLKSKDPKLDAIVLKFVLESFDFKAPLAMDSLDTEAVLDMLTLNESLMLSIGDDSRLRTLLNSTEYGKLKQAYLMPVSISFEIQNPQKFTPSLFGFRSHNYGIIKVSLHEPYTFSDLLQHVKPAASASEKRGAIRGHLLHDIVFMRSVMSTDLVAFLLLVYFRKGGTLEEFVAKADEIQFSNPTIDFAFEGNTVDVVIYALRILDKKIVINEQLVIRPLEDTATLIELWDYAETLVCNYALQSAVVLSAEHLKRVSGDINYDDMLQMASDLCAFLHLEIPYDKACSSLNEQLATAFDKLTRMELMIKPSRIYTEEEMRARRIAATYLDENDESDDECDDSTEIITINDQMQRELDALKNVLLPLQETYMNVIYCFKRLVGPQTMSETDFLNISMDAMMEECYSNQCKYWESCNMKWMKNCLRHYETLKVVDKMKTSDTFVFLTTEYNCEDEIDKIAKRIERFSVYT